MICSGSPSLFLKKRSKGWSEAMVKFGISAGNRRNP